MEKNQENTIKKNIPSSDNRNVGKTNDDLKIKIRLSGSDDEQLIGGYKISKGIKYRTGNENDKIRIPSLFERMGWNRDKEEQLENVVVIDIGKGKKKWNRKKSARRQKLTTIVDTEALTRNEEWNRREKMVNDDAEELSKKYGIPICVHQTLKESFNFNALNFGESYSISYEECELSKSVLEMLIVFKENIFKNSAKKALDTRVEKSNEYALEIGKIVQNIKTDLQNNNTKPTFQRVADSLKEKEIELPFGGFEWTPATVRRIEQKFKQLESENFSSFHPPQ